jgi:hypothetical protein
MPSRPDWSTRPISNDHSRPRLHIWMCSHGCFIPKSDLDKAVLREPLSNASGGERIYVVFNVGDCIWRTVWFNEHSLSEPVASDDGELMRDAGEGGEGSDVQSFKRWTTESEGREGSVWLDHSLSGSLPVEENTDTIPGWVEVENILVVGVTDWASQSNYFIAKRITKQVRPSKGNTLSDNDRILSPSKSVPP